MKGITIDPSKTLMVLSVVVCLAGCFGKPKYKEAKFTTATKEATEEQLRQLGSFEDAKIAWSARTFDDKVTHNLKIQLLNGEIPENDSVEYATGKKALQIVIEAIENEADYDNFVVFFVKRKRDGAMTTGSEKPYEYQLDELK
jgi:hypothetical protein